MTKLLRKLEPRGASEELEHRSDSVKKAVYSKVASDIFRGMLAVVSALLLVVVLVVMLVQQYALSETLEGIEANRQVAIEATDTLADVSVFAAYCAKLPENNTVANIQQCIETNMKAKRKR